MEKNLPFIIHLAELRKRIIIAGISVVIASLAAMPFSSALLGVFTAPAQDLLGKLAVFSPQEALAVYVRIGIVSGIVASVPVILHQAWSFIAPALGTRVRRYAFWFIAAATLAFLAGCIFAYFILIPPALRFLLGIGTNDFIPLISASKYISFVTTLVLACGVMFLMPAVIFILVKIGIVTARVLFRHFPVAVVGILVVAAIITPTTDIFNMMVLAVPMIVLYGVSIGLAWFAGRNRTSGRGERMEK